jgi:general stress protein 26
MHGRSRKGISLTYTIPLTRSPLTNFSSHLKEGGGIDLLFHTNTESGKTSDLADDPSINISFLNSTGEWASISGSSKILTDREAVRKYYSPQLKTWVGDLGDGKHDGGPEDPRIGIIKVEAKTITYAAARGNPVSRGVEMVKGAVTGEAAQVNKLREISEEEIQKWRDSHS